MPRSPVLWAQTQWPAGLLFILALGLRGAYVLMALAQVGLDSLSHTAPDTNFYYLIADHFLHGDPNGASNILMGGPGYGLMLAGTRLLFGENTLWPILINLLLGSLAPVVIYKLTLELLASRKMAIVAGLFSAVSLTGIAMSAQVLTDQPFFTFHALALWCFVRGYRTTRRRWFVLAGLVAGWAALVRTTGGMWPYLFLLIAVLVPKQNVFASRRQMILRSALAGIVMLAIVLGWSARNYATHGLFTFATNGVLSVRGYLVNLAVAEHTPGVDWARQGLEWSVDDSDRTAPPAVSYARAEARVRRVIAEHPAWVLETYWGALQGNIRAPNPYLDRQIPSVRPFTRFVYHAIESWLGYAMVCGSLLGLVILLARRRYLAGVLLGVTYLYFTAITGLSFWQGSRLHYPAEMASSPLLAYVVVGAAGLVWRGWHRLRLGKPTALPVSRFGDFVPTE